MSRTYSFECTSCLKKWYVNKFEDMFNCPECSGKLKLLPDPVSPMHYQTGAVECIDVAETMSFNMGNALKYIWRAGRKDTTKLVEDLKKAQWYIEREITRREKTS